MTTTTTPRTEGEALAALIAAAPPGRGWCVRHQPFAPLAGAAVVYRCEIGDARRMVEGRGPTPLAAMCEALRLWERAQQRQGVR